MKIGIVTLYGNTNYGNRLQNYAIQEILRQRGYEVETLVCKKNTAKNRLRKVYHGVMSPLGEKKSRRMSRFNRFNKEMVPTRVIAEKNGLLPERIAREYDFFVTGSDQVWNPNIRLHEKDNFFLRFARPEQRICLAPSIAAEEIPPSCMTEYQIGLAGFPYLSCRERSGAQLISRITGRACENIIDPTLALDAQVWRSFSKPVCQKRRYILLFFLGAVSDQIRRLVRREAQERDLDVVELSSVQDPHFVSTPENFVWLIDHAELVLTDSFHGTAFALNLNTPFYVFNRDARKENERRIVSRITSLTETFGLSDRYVKDTLQVLDFSCSFETGNRALEAERQKFAGYLDRCLSQKTQPTSLLPDRHCTGCGVCAQVCPKSCIRMERDAEGFLRPVIDQRKFVSCGKCAGVCPVLGSEALAVNEVEQVFAAIHNDPVKLNQSSSGAIFPLMAEWVIRQNGVVFGAGFDDGFQVAHSWANTERDIRRFYTSKYVQSHILECYAKAAEFLKNGQMVLFSGTPCQIAAIRSYLGKDYERLILVECACHGVPSPKVWKAYLEHISSKYLHDEHITYINFREKVDGQLFFLKASGKVHGYVKSYREDLYLQGFLRNLILRPSCTVCRFKGTRRVADITLADFWGISKACPEFPQKEGASMVMINSARGKQLWDAIACRELYAQAVAKEKVVGKVNSAIWKPVRQHGNRRLFFNAIDTMDIDKALAQYATAPKVSLAKKACRKIRRILVKQ